METALFSASSLFGDASDKSSDEETNTQEDFVERTHQFPGMELVVREFSFHQLNANLLWPGTFAFAEWLVQHRSWVEGRCVLELGSGTGALAIFMERLLQLDITTSDYDDQEIEDNIAYNCKINGIIPPLPHVKHTWGDAFPIAHPNWDLVIASDILLCVMEVFRLLRVCDCDMIMSEKLIVKDVKQYPKLIKTLSFLLRSYQPAGNVNTSSQNEQGLPYPAFLMSWRRRIGKDDESLFFKGCKDAGLEVRHLGSRVYCITLSENCLQTSRKSG